MKTFAEMLQSSDWGKSLSSTEQEKVMAGTVERRYNAGSFICHKGEQVENWIGVIDGLVKIASHWITGKTVTFTGVPPGGWLGEGSMLKNEARKYDVVALRDSHLALMNRATFQWLLDHSLAFNRSLLIHLNERLGQFIGMVEHERLLGTDARIARVLAAMFNPILYPRAGPQLAISQEELGYLSGVSRQRVNLALKRLAGAGLLEVSYGGISVLDLPGLQAFEGLQT